MVSRHCYLLSDDLNLGMGQGFTLMSYQHKVRKTFYYFSFTKYTTQFIFNYLYVGIGSYGSYQGIVTPR